jgi:hypothetical protein
VWGDGDGVGSWRIGDGVSDSWARVCGGSKVEAGPSRQRNDVGQDGGSIDSGDEDY